MLKSSHRLFGLDLIRAVAISLVILSHCTFLLPKFDTHLTDAIRLLGATGVDIFFVLSGYLIGGILIKKIRANQIRSKDLFHFWKRRWLRTLPNYFVVLILNMLLIVIFTGSILNQAWMYPFFIQNLQSAHPDFFTEAWSLSIEEYAYLILPLFLYGSIWVVKPKKPLNVFIGVTLVVIFLLYLFKIKYYFEAEIRDYGDWSGGFRKVVIYRLDAIYYGFIMVYLCKTKTRLYDYKNLLSIIGGVLFIGMHLFILQFKMLPQTHLFFYTCLYLTLVSLSIALVFPFFSKLNYSGIFKPITEYISTRSYAMYLVNYSLILLSIQRFWEPSILSVITYLFFTVVFSEILYRGVELPILKYRNRNFKS